MCGALFWLEDEFGSWVLFRFKRGDDGLQQSSRPKERPAAYRNMIARNLTAKQGQGQPKEALLSMWLVWQFAQNKINLITQFDNKISEETDENIKQLFVSSKSWLVNGIKPNLNN